MSFHDAMQVLPGFLARLPLRHLDLGNCRHLNLDVIPAMTQLEVLSLSVSLLFDQENVMWPSYFEALWLCLGTRMLCDCLSLRHFGCVFEVQKLLLCQRVLFCMFECAFGLLLHSLTQQSESQSFWSPSNTTDTKHRHKLQYHKLQNSLCYYAFLSLAM